MSNALVPRYDRIGGSDAAAILGRNPYRTPLDVFHDKVHRVERDLTNHHIERGNEMEPKIEAFVREKIDPTMNSLANFEQHDAAPDQGYQITAYNAKWPYLGGHPDGVGDGCVWEFKAPTMRKFFTILDNGIPDEWLYQVFHYMIVLEKRWGVVAMWNYDKWEPYLIKLRLPNETKEMMLGAYEMFWDAVLKGREAADAGHTPDFELDMLPEAAQQQMIYSTDQDVQHILSEYQRAYTMRYAGLELQKEMRGRIMSIAGDVPHIVTPTHTCTIGTAVRNGFSFKRVVVKARAENQEELDDE